MREQVGVENSRHRGFRVDEGGGGGGALALRTLPGLRVDAVKPRTSSLFSSSLL